MKAMRGSFPPGRTFHNFNGNHDDKGKFSSGDEAPGYQNPEMRTKSGDRLYHGDSVKFGKIKGRIVASKSDGSVSIRDPQGAIHSVPHYEDLKLDKPQ